MKNGSLFSFGYNVVAAPKLPIKKIMEIARGMPQSEKRGRHIDGRFIMKNIEEDSYDVLDLTEEGITLTCYTTSTGVREKTLGLLRLLGILAYLKDAYDVKMDSIYTLLTTALYAAQFAVTANNDAYKETLQVEMLSSSNAMLAIELRRLSKTNDTLAHKCMIYEEFCVETLKKFPKKEISTFGGLGVNTDTIKKVVELVEGGSK